MWGKVRALTKCLNRKRITPTYVGKSGATKAWTAAQWGSPPRMWGKAGT